MTHHLPEGSALGRAAETEDHRSREASNISPEGGVLVPREPTLEMQHAYFDVIDRNMKRVQTDCRFGRYDSHRQAYAAMLSAAPPVSPRGVGDREAIARIIDEQAFMPLTPHHERSYQNLSLEDARARAFAKADQIAALSLPTGSGEGLDRLKVQEAIRAALAAHIFAPTDVGVLAAYEVAVKISGDVLAALSPTPGLGNGNAARDHASNADAATPKSAATEQVKP